MVSAYNTSGRVSRGQVRQGSYLVMQLGVLRALTDTDLVSKNKGFYRNLHMLNASPIGWKTLAGNNLYIIV